MNNLGELIRAAAERFSSSDSARLDAELIMAHCLQKDRTWLFAWPEATLDEAQLQAFESLVSRREGGEPIAYILGYREFWGLNLACTPDTLIPRPDTELLVEIALSLELPADAKVLDLGTGTGAIALVLAHERVLWQVAACDIAAEAVALARRNAAALNLSRVEFFQSNWFDGLAGHGGYDLIVANPPYVEKNSPWLTQGDVRFEPNRALVSGKDGLDDIRTIVAQAPKQLKPAAWLLLEHGFEQGSAVAHLLQTAGFESVRTAQDLAGLARATCGKKAS